GQQEQEVAQQLVVVAEDVLDRGCPRARVELRVAQQLAELGHLRVGLNDLLELLADRLEPGLLQGRLQERVRRDAGGDRPSSCCSSAEKSASPPASSISLRWSASSSDLRVTFWAASRLRSTTSARIASRARRVSASICLRVSSSRR